jgi:hypothetical protein
MVESKPETENDLSTFPFWSEMETDADLFPR